MIRRLEAPSERAASTNSFSRSDSTWPRTMRAMYGPVDERDHEDDERHARLDQPAEAAVAPRARGGEAEAEQQDREASSTSTPREIRVSTQPR